MSFGSYLRSLRSISRNAKLYVVVSGCVAFCFFGVFAVLYNLFLLRLGYDAVFIGLANGITGTGFALFSFPAGLIGARIGYRRAMTIGAGCGIVASTLLPIALFLPAAVRGPWLVLWYGIFGAAVSMILVNGVPFMMASSSEGEHSHVFAAAAAAPAIGGFAGSIVAGLLPVLLGSLLGLELSEARPYGFSLWLAPIIYVLLLMALRATTPVTRRMEPHETRSRAGVPLGLILTCALMVFLRTSTYFAFIAFFNVYLDTVFGSPPSSIGALTAFGRLSMAVGALATPILVARWKRYRAAVILLCFLVVAGVVSGVFRTIILVTVSFVGVCAGTAAMDAVFGVFSQKIAPEPHRGMMSGAVSLGAGLSFAATSYGGGFIVQGIGFRPLFFLASILCLVGVALFALTFGTRKGEALRRLGNS